MSNHLHITFLPLLPHWAFMALAVFAILAVVYAFYRRSSGAVWRGLVFVFILITLLNPRLTTEQREPLKDTALIVVDDTASMNLEDRNAQKNHALESLQQKIAALDNITSEVIHVKGQDETDLFHAITQKLSDRPSNRLAGIIMLTDGAVHDAPLHFMPHAPLHILLAGHKDEFDRRMVIKQAPAYGIVGKTVTAVVRVEDEPKAQSATAIVTIHHDDGTTQQRTVPVNEDVTLDMDVPHAGANLIGFTTEALPSELTPINNSARMNINGIRDRLRVLLISGEPHTGERVWRNFLKADAAVDLVHFTILRSPDKSDAVPLRQMALIAFPVQELFETKLHSFDLIIFDRFNRNGLIAPDYLDNIAHYVDEGGALLVTNSTADNTDENALNTSPLASILPLQPTGVMMTGVFTPTLTSMGLHHPVTNTLFASDTHVGAWLRQTETIAKDDAAVLMTGLNNKPLLALSHVGKGRVAQFASDQFWLWARHYDNGGPQAEMLKRTAHWLMQEPELDESALTALAEQNDGNWQISVAERSLDDKPRTLDVTDPDGNKTTVSLITNDKTRTLNAIIPAPNAGLYHVRDGDKQTLVLVGITDAPEYGAMRALDTKLAPLVKESGGGLAWLEDEPNAPDLRRPDVGSSQEGWHWMGLQRNGQYRVTGSKTYPLWPAWLGLALLLGTAMLAWHREGKK